MKKPGRKGSDMEREERVLYILSLRSKGIKSTSDLFRFFTEKYPEFTKRQFEYDLRSAKEKIKEYSVDDFDEEVSELMKHYWELYNKSLNLQDYRECRALLSEIAKLKGLNAVKQKEVTIVTELANKPEWFD